MNNKKLKNLIKLSSKVAIYVPSTQNVNTEIDNGEHVHNALILLSDLFGGATTTKAIGSWLSVDHSLVREKIDLVYAYTDSNKLENSIDTILAFCEQLKKDMQQEAIAIEINNELYFI